MNYLILGSGFGLYGYLPSIYSFADKIYLNSVYKKKFRSRNELRNFKSKIIWYEKLDKIINDINIIIIAKTPSLQFLILKKILKKKRNFQHIFLEKPINTNPDNSKKLLNFLIKKKLKFSFGFIFRHLKWYRYLKDRGKNNLFKISWQIKKRNNSNSWKYRAKSGGGLLRFYGIHFMILFYELNITKILNTKILRNIVEFNLEDKNKNNVNLNIAYNSKEKFILKKNNKYLVNKPNPFSEIIANNKRDPRIKFLKKYIKENLKKKTFKEKDYLSFVNFWKKIELN